MDYEKAYKEALERERKINSGEGVATPLDWTTCEVIFPELKESEDEKIRKAIHIYLDWLDGRKDIEPRGEYTLRDMIAWLEKQGNHNEQNFWERCNHCEYFDGHDLCLHKKNFGSVTDESQENCRNNELFIEKQCEQKPTDKVDPKFKVGNWIVYEGLGTYKVIEIHKGWYSVIDSNDRRWSVMFENESLCHLWTIQDAEDGDILYHKRPETGIEYIVMSRSVNDCGNIDSYFRYNSEDGFGINIPSVLSGKFDDITPATKEQCDLLFQKMHEAGFRWNAEKKELTKIEQESSWSEEDATHYNRILKELNLQKETPINDSVAEEIKSDIIWLKSLKDRVQPQPKQDWSENDEKIFEEVCDSIKYAEKHRITCSEKLAKLQLDWLKSIKDRVQPQT